MMHARCFLCGTRITSNDLRYEGRESALIVRRYECSLCNATHEVKGFVAHAASTSVSHNELVVSRRRATDDLTALAQALVNEDYPSIPLAFLADLSQLAFDWASGEPLSGAVGQEFQRIRQLDGDLTPQAQPTQGNRNRRG